MKTMFKKVAMIFVVAFGFFNSGARALTTLAVEAEKKNDPKTGLSVESFDSLPWEDQERIRQALEQLGERIDGSIDMNDIIFTIKEGKISVIGIKKDGDHFYPGGMEPPTST